MTDYELNRCKQCGTMKHLSICERCYGEQKARADKLQEQYIALTIIAERLESEAEKSEAKQKEAADEVRRIADTCDSAIEVEASFDYHKEFEKLRTLEKIMGDAE